MKLQESAEMYLETILILKNEKGMVRSVDIADYMNYSKPSVSRAVGILRENGYINIDEDGHISLTRTGLEHAEKIYERHVWLTQFLVSLGVEAKTAQEDACRIEHVISEESFARMKEHAAGCAAKEG
ncbi:MAG: metal-dependent transcriptional regulator [Oscillospiraceae bacterium]|nr:metal-dependent transcriptional regulator [Oscillospiraceae bacterium]